MCGAVLAFLAVLPMGKSVLDAGWSVLRTMLRYKSDDAGDINAAENIVAAGLAVWQ